MELKTDKIYRILNTPYDELMPHDFAAAQEQLDVLVVGARDKQIDAFQFIENKLVCERDEALKRVSQLTDQLAAQQEKPIALELMARIADLKRVAQTDAEAIANLIKERDQLDDELTELRQAPSGTAKQAARIRELEDMMRIMADACAKQVAGLEHTIGLLRLDVERKNAGLMQSTANLMDNLMDNLMELEQARNSSAMVVAITAERDAAQERELKALRQLAEAMERADRAEQRERDGNARRERAVKADQKALVSKWFDVVFDGPPGPESGRFVEVEDESGKSINIGRWIDRGDGMWALRIGETPAGALAKLVDEETAAANEAMDKREAELDKYGYGRAPGTPPAEVVGLGGSDVVDGRLSPQEREYVRSLPDERPFPEPVKTCSMPTPDGPCTARATGRNNGWPFCSRHLDAIRGGQPIRESDSAEAGGGLSGVATDQE